jgi:hypothetical protein
MRGDAWPASPTGEYVRYADVADAAPKLAEIAERALEAERDGGRGPAHPMNAGHGGLCVQPALLEPAGHRPATHWRGGGRLRLGSRHGSVTQSPELLDAYRYAAAVTRDGSSACDIGIGERDDVYAGEDPVRNAAFAVPAGSRSTPGALSVATAWRRRCRDAGRDHPWSALPDAAERANGEAWGSCHAGVVGRKRGVGFACQMATTGRRGPLMALAADVVRSPAEVRVMRIRTRPRRPDANRPCCCPRTWMYSATKVGNDVSR